MGILPVVFLFSPPNRPQCGFNRNSLQLIRKTCCPEFSHPPQLEILCTAPPVVLITLLLEMCEIHNSIERPLPPFPPSPQLQTPAILLIFHATQTSTGLHVVSFLGNNIFRTFKEVVRVRDLQAVCLSNQPINFSPFIIHNPFCGQVIFVKNPHTH